MSDAGCVRVFSLRSGAEVDAASAQTPSGYHSTTSASTTVNDANEHHMQNYGLQERPRNPSLRNQAAEIINFHHIVRQPSNDNSQSSAHLHPDKILPAGSRAPLLNSRQELLAISDDVCERVNDMPASASEGVWNTMYSEDYFPAVRRLVEVDRKLQSRYGIAVSRDSRNRLDYRKFPCYHPDHVTGFDASKLDFARSMEFCQERKNVVCFGLNPDPSEPIYTFLTCEFKITNGGGKKGKLQVLSGMMISHAAFAHLKALVRSTRSIEEINNGLLHMDEPVYTYGLLLQGCELTFYIMTDVGAGMNRKFIYQEFWKGDISNRDKCLEAHTILYRIYEQHLRRHRVVSTWIRLSDGITAEQAAAFQAQWRPSSSPKDDDRDDGGEGDEEGDDNGEYQGDNYDTDGDSVMADGQESTPQPQAGPGPQTAATRTLRQQRQPQPSPRQAFRRALRDIKAEGFGSRDIKSWLASIEVSSRPTTVGPSPEHINSHPSSIPVEGDMTALLNKPVPTVIRQGHAARHLAVMAGQSGPPSARSQHISPIGSDDTAPYTDSRTLSGSDSRKGRDDVMREEQGHAGEDVDAFENESKDVGGIHGDDTETVVHNKAELSHDEFGLEQAHSLSPNKKDPCQPMLGSNIVTQLLLKVNGK